MKQINRIAALLLSAFFLLQCAVPAWADEAAQEPASGVEQQLDTETGLGADVPGDDNEKPHDTEDAGESGEDDPNADGSDEDNSDEDNSDEDGSDEDGSDEDSSDENGSDEDGSDADSSDEDGSDEDGSGEDNSDEDGSDEDNSDEDGSDADGSGEDGSDEDGSDEDGSGEDSSDEDSSDEDGSDEDNSDEDGSGEDNSDEELEEEEPPELPGWYDPDAEEYQLDSAEMLAELARLSVQESFAGKTILLTRDLSGVVLTAPIGTEENPFQGTFDGGWHTISFDQSQAAPCGLFGVMENAQVSGLHLSGLWVSSDEYFFGALAACMTNTEVNRVWLEDITLEGEGISGAMAGWVRDTEFFGCMVSGLQGDQTACSYVYASFDLSTYYFCYAVQCGGRQVAEIADYRYLSLRCVQDGTSPDFYLGFMMVSDQKTAVYCMNLDMTDPVWAVENGVAAPKEFLTEAAMTPFQVTIALKDTAAKGALSVNGASLSGGYTGCCFPGDQLTLDYQQPVLPYQTAVEIQCSDPEGLVPLEGGGWQFTGTGGDVEITISLTITGGYDISWYLGHEHEEAFYIATPSQLTGLSLLVSGDTLEVTAPVSFEGAVIYLMNDVTLPANWQSIGSALTPFSGGFEALDPGEPAEQMEDGESGEEAGEDGGETAGPVPVQHTVTLSDAPLFGALSGARVSGLRLECAESLSSSPLAQSAVNTTFENCASSVNVKNTMYTGTGGLVGVMTGGGMSGCSAVGSVSSGSYTGGLVGRLTNAELTGCSFSGSVTSSTYAGGLVGSVSASQLTGCTASGSVSGSTYVGGLAGLMNGSQLTSCTISSSVTGSSYTGGLAGSVSASQLTGCTVSGSVSGAIYVGGAAGLLNSSELVDCSNSSQVYATSSYAGGLAGAVRSASTVQNGKNTGEVRGDSQYVGGLVGYGVSLTVIGGVNTGAVSAAKEYAGGIAGCVSAGTLKDCVNTGAVQAGPQCAGGIAGFAGGGSTVENCVNEGEISGTYWVGGVTGYITNSQMTGCENRACTLTGILYVGGLAGAAMGQSTLTDCRNTGASLTAEGGVAGKVENSTLVRCTNSAALTGEFSFVGGIVGRATGLTAQDCVNTGAVTGPEKASGCVGQLDGVSVLSGCENTGDVNGPDLASGIACVTHVGYSAAVIQLTAENCVNRGTISSSCAAAGLFGAPIPTSASNQNLAAGNVTDCVNCGDVTAANVAGGIVSVSYGIAVASCRNEGDISLKSGASIYYIRSAGGIAGYCKSQVSDCLNTGSVSAAMDAVTLSGAGGIIGMAEGIGQARGCLSLGQVSGCSLLCTGAVTGKGYTSSYNCYSGPEVLDDPCDRDYITILTEEQVISGEGAWLLNKSTAWNSFGWGQDSGLGHPVPAGDGSSAIRKLTVSISDGGAVSGLPEGMYLPQGTRFSLTPVPDEGMIVTRFFFDNKDLRGQEIPEDGLLCVMPGWDSTLEVRFGAAPTQETCTVTFDLQNEEPPMVQTVQAGENASRPEDTPQWEDHSFLGWYTQPSGGEVYTFDEAVTADLTLYAHWSSKNDVTVLFHVSDGDICTVTAERGAKIDAPQMERVDVEVDGILFSTSRLTGWRGVNDCVWDGTATPLNALQTSLELWPQWETKDCLLESAKESPVEFTTVAQLAQLAKNVAAGEDYAGCRFILAQDITLTSSWRTPIGSYDDGMPFSGEFQAANGARIILNNALYPLFGYLGENARVSGMTITGTAVQIKSDSGGLVMWNEGRVSNITAEDLTLGHVYTDRVGGIAGWNLPGGVVEDCTLSGSAISGRGVGGIVSTNGGTVRNCETDEASSISTGGDINRDIGNIYAYPGYCDTLGAGGIVSTNIRGAVENCRNSAQITANGCYSIVGGILGVWRSAGSSISQEQAINWEDGGSLLNCTNLGNIQVSVEYPIVGGVLGMYSDLYAPFTADTISGAVNAADIQVKNTGSNMQLKSFASVGGVIGKLREIVYLNHDWVAEEIVEISGLTHSGNISAENCHEAGGILGGSYSCRAILKDCVAKGTITGRDTSYVGGIFGCAELCGADPESYYYGGGGDRIGIDRCMAELDIRAEGSVIFAGGVAASRMGVLVGIGNTGLFNPVTITDSGHFGALTAPEGTWDGVCPVNCVPTRSWHGSETDALVVIDSTAEDGGRYELSAEAMTSGEAAWLLDGGEDSSLGLWTQGGSHPVLGQPPLRRISVQSSENGSVTVNGASTVYAAVGSTLQVSVQPSRESVEQDGVKLGYVLENVTLTWTDEEGNIQERDITDTLSLTVPGENASLTARFALEELPPVEEPEEEPEEEQPDIKTGDSGSGSGTGTGAGEEAADPGIGTGTGEGTGDSGSGSGSADSSTGTGTGEDPAEEPSSGADAPVEEPSEGTGSTDSDTPLEEETPDVSQTPEEQKTSDLPVPPLEEPEQEIPDELPPMAGMDVTGSSPAVSPIGPAGAGADGQGEKPPIFELLPEPLRQPHVAAVILSLLALLAIGTLWQGRKSRKYR